MRVSLDADELEQLHRAVRDTLLLAVLGGRLESESQSFACIRQCCPARARCRGMTCTQQPDVLEGPSDAERRHWCGFEPVIAALEDDLPAVGERCR